jgi:ribosome-associated translation inhibitor RaiA
MNAPVEVHFHGIQKSEAIEQRVRNKVAKLEKHFGRMTSCRVLLEAAQRNAQKPKVYTIKIEIGIPRQRSIVICHERTGAHASEELTLALRDAFEVALRKMDGITAKRGQRSRLERGRRRPSTIPRGPATA